ncbi:MAG: glycosyltransferase family 39 protein [Anaerolineae bacterium]
MLRDGPGRWWPGADAVLVVVLFVGLALVYSLVTPVFEGFDEVWHYAFVQHVASGQGLPRQPAEQYPHLAAQEASQPPLYYLLGAALTFWTPTDDFALYLRQNPQFRPLPTPYQDNQNYIVHPSAETFPYTGTALAVHLTRLLSVVLGAGTVLCAYWLGRRLYPKRRSVAIGAMLLTAFTPAFIFSSALANNDILVTFLCSLALALLLDAVAQPASRGRAIVLGVVLGCAALAKLSGLLLWPFAAAVLLLCPVVRDPAALETRERNETQTNETERSETQRRRDAKEERADVSSSFASLRLCVSYLFSGEGGLNTVVGQMAVVFGVALLVSGWWFARNWLLYGDVTGLNMHMALMGRRPDGFGLRDILGEAQGLRWSYWAMFGWFNIPMPTALYRAFDIATLAAVVGLVVYIARALRRRRPARLWPLAYLGAWLVLVAAGVVRWSLTTPGSQGRLLYPAVTAIATLLVVGWLALVPGGERVRRWVVAGIGVAMFAVAAAVPFLVIAPTYAPPPMLSADAVNRAIAQSTDATFDNGVRLLGYRVETDTVAPGETAWVTACWEGTRPMSEDVFVFLHLLTDGDIIAAQKDTYHGMGLFPTSRWAVGARFCDRYPLAVPDTAPAAPNTTLALGLYDESGKRLAVTNAGGPASADEVRLPGPSITARPEDSLTYEWGHRLGLIEYELDQTAVRPGESFTLGLRWRALEAMPDDYAVTVQVFDANGAKVAQSDEPLRTRGQPTSAWRVGTTMKDTRSVAIAPDTPPGVYEIRVGVYDFATKRTLLPSHNGETLNSGPVAIWKVRLR